MVLLDIEYTSWEGSQERRWSEPWEEKETVQIAMLAVNAETLEPLGHLSCLVKPTLNPQLSDYFMKLTGITQHSLDRDGMSLNQAFEKSAEFVASYGDQTVVVSNGNDGQLLKENADLVGVACPDFFPYGISIHRYLKSNLVGYRDHFCTGDLPDVIQRPLEGHKHNALYDVHAIAHVLRYIREITESRSVPVSQPA